MAVTDVRTETSEFGGLPWQNSGGRCTRPFAQGLDILFQSFGSGRLHPSVSSFFTRTPVTVSVPRIHHSSAANTYDRGLQVRIVVYDGRQTPAVLRDNSHHGVRRR